MACSNKKIKSRRKKMSVGGILSSTTGMASTGSAFGPVGTGVGAAVGLGLGAYQYIQDQEAEKKRQNQLAQQRRIDSAYNTTDFTYARPMELMPYGGVPGAETVELEQGEAFRMPNGQMGMISEQAPTHQQGGVPITLPTGTQVLGKKTLMNDITFKKEGAKLKRQFDKYTKILEDHPTRIQEQTSKLMLKKINNKFSSLFQMQGEDTGMPMMEVGGVIGGMMAKMERYPNGGTIHINPENKGKFNALKKRTGKSTEELTHSKNPLTRKRAIFAQNAAKWRKGPEGLMAGADYFKQNPNYLRAFQNQYGLNVDNIYGPKTESAWGQYGQEFINNYNTNQIQPINTQQSIEPLRPNVNTTSLSTPFAQQTVNNVGTQTDFNLNASLGNLATLAPVAYNLAQGLQTPQKMESQDYQNPYINKIRSTMASRRYNVKPELEQNRLNQATYNRSLSEAAPSQAQLLGGMQAGSIQKQRADSESLARMQNVNNQYLAEQASMDANLGQGIADTRKYAEDVNARTIAARQNMVGTGLSQLSNFTQNKQYMNNQMVRDAQRMNLLPSLVQNFTLGPDGNWIFKQNNQPVDQQFVWNFIQGNNIK